MIWSGFLFRFT
uniref:Uncharacterized protein n=1 Tax=Arundo donax TaxID=35708 RepID=A0A0A9FRZ6_ARUDO